MEEQFAPGPSDSELVARARVGDRDAFAAIYDRYSDRLHDFCWSMLRNRDDAADATQDTFLRAVERLGQLKEPAKLRSWLYSIARNEALSRLRSRRRQVPGDSIPELPDPARGPEASAGESELRQLVWDAAAGLGERDRVLLDLHVRQGLDGAELADAAGVGAGHVYVLLGRLRDQVERSLGALLVARLGRAECVELDSILSGWDGSYSALVRKRVARHVDGCETCGERRRTAAGPMALLSAVPVMLAPAELRDVVLSAFGAPSTDHRDDGPDDGTAAAASESAGAGDGHWPWWRRPSRRTAALVSAAVVVVAGGVLAGLTLTGSDHDTHSPAAALTDAPSTLSPPPGAPALGTGPVPALPSPDDAGPAGDAEDIEDADDRQEAAGQEGSSADNEDQAGAGATPPGPGNLSVSAVVLDLGSQETGGRVGLHNGGESALTYQVVSDSPWLTVDHAGGALEPGEASELTVSADRSALTEGDHRSVVQLSSAAGDASVEVVLAVERTPVIEDVAAEPAVIGVEQCTPNSTQVQVRASDESGLSGVELSWNAAGGSGTVGMAERGGTWYAQLGPFTTPGSMTWHVTAVDTRGNVATSESRALTVNPCPQ